MASRSAARLSTESAAARTERLASTASTMSARRARLSVEESLQNSQGTVCVARLRASQSPAQKTLRHLRDSTAKACSRESPAQTTVRRDINVRSTASAKALESPAQTSVRRVRNARSTASARALHKSLFVALEMPALLRLPGLQKTLKYAVNCSKTLATSSFFEWRNFAGEPPQFLQIYSLADYNEQVDARLGILPSDISVGPRRDILFRLQDMLHETNSYIRSLNFAASVKPTVHTTVSSTPFFFHTEAMGTTSKS
ncbi:unnamed protein product [Acanthosepion pharaonis]|uniref:Uncharacterized protein n=1 Tax=Acanthosepion pharaonis TaxID=158019 RepID=A0A812EAM0_ACAPH|nr:unnamed protein product [Sepia pharaonis]